MIRILKNSLNLFLTTLLLMVSLSVFPAEKQLADLTGEDRDMYDQFFYLLNHGTPDEFYTYVEKYEKDLHDKGYMMLYYKLKFLFFHI